MANCPHCDLDTDSQQEIDSHIAAIHPNDELNNPTNIAPSFATLAEAQAWKLARINLRSKTLIAQGYEYPPASGKIMGLGGTSQNNALALIKADDDGILTWPIQINTQDDLSTITLNNRVELDAYYDAGAGAMLPIMGGGTALKEAVRAAATINDVLAIEDTR